MTRPTDDISWATAANYPAGPDSWAGTPNTSEPSVGRKAEGWDPAQKPAAQQFNFWMRGASRWIAWLQNQHDQYRTLAMSPQGFVPCKGTTASDADGRGSTGGVAFSAGSLKRGLDLPIGMKLVGARFNVADNASGPTLVGTILYKVKLDGTGGVVNLGTPTTSAGTGVAQVLDVGVMNETIDPLFQYTIGVSLLVVAGLLDHGSLCSFRGVTLTYQPIDM